jgi:hypothetical protein
MTLRGSGDLQTHAARLDLKAGMLLNLVRTYLIDGQRPLSPIIHNRIIEAKAETNAMIDEMLSFYEET